MKTIPSVLSITRSWKIPKAEKWECYLNYEQIVGALV